MTHTLKVGCFVLNRSHNKILLLKEIYLTRDEAKWNIIKGTCDKAGETADQCIRREIIEEANVEVSNLALRHIMYYGTVEKPKLILLFTATANSEPTLSTLDDQKARGEEIIKIQWFSQQEYNNLDKHSLMGDYITAIDPFIPENKVTFSTST